MKASRTMKKKTKKSDKRSQLMKRRWATAKMANGSRYVVFDKFTNRIVGELKLEIMS